MASPINVGPIPGFPGARRIGTLREDLKLWKYNWLKQAKSAQPQSINLSVEDPPLLLGSHDARTAYQSGDYEKIQSLESTAKDDLVTIDDNIRVHGYDAFIKVQNNGIPFYICYNQKATVWIYNEKTEKTVSDDGDVKFINYHQVGKYTVNGGMAGNTSSIFSTSGDIVGVLPGMVAALIQSVLSQGTKTVIGGLLSAVTQFAGTLGIVANVTATLTSAFAGSALFTIAFNGIMFFWDWANAKYTVELRIYNWSKEHALSVSKCYTANVNMICDEQDIEKACEVVIPKMLPEGSKVGPPGFDPPSTMEDACMYVTYIFNNDDTFMAGCGIGLKLELDQKDSGKGFMYAFDCPWNGSNKQKAEPILKDPQEYYDGGNWSENPLEFSIRTLEDQIPISIKLDALGGNDNTYRPIVNFSKE